MNITSQVIDELHIAIKADFALLVAHLFEALPSISLLWYLRLTGQISMPCILIVPVLGRQSF
jgi:hypothetical protein